MSTSVFYIRIYSSPISELQFFMYEDSYIEQPQPQTAAGSRQQAGALFPIYESSYIKICNSDIGLLYAVCYTTKKAKIRKYLLS